MKLSSTTCLIVEAESAGYGVLEAGGVAECALTTYGRAGDPGGAMEVARAPVAALGDACARARREVCLRAEKVPDRWSRPVGSRIRAFAEAVDDAAGFERE
jgi:hypothetical protein